MFNQKVKITYLKDAKNLQELKKLYFSLSKKYHPDIVGGDLEIMQQINNEYDYLKTILKNAEPKTEEEKKQNRENIHTMNAFKDIINDLIKYPKIIIEIVGSWLWISGTGTFTIKDEILKEKYSCKWSKPSKKWYWFNGITEQEWKPRGGYLSKAISKYGIHRIESDPLPQLT